MEIISYGDVFDKYNGTCQMMGRKRKNYDCDDDCGDDCFDCGRYGFDDDDCGCDDGADCSYD